jgi:hypothetical protein
VDNPIRIDLHTRVRERLPVHEVEITAQTLPPQMHAGLNAYPCQVALMRHLLLHTAGNLREKAVRLIQLQDIVRLAQHLGQTEWQSLLSTTANRWWALPPLSLADRYFPGCIPAFVIADLQVTCPAWLRVSLRRQRLADVSLSRVDIPAFPGLEWSQSPAEAFKMAFKRVFPDREKRAMTEAFIRMQPSASSTRWTGSSQLWKIVTWVLVRAPRVATLYSVRLAMDYQAR